MHILPFFFKSIFSYFRISIRLKLYKENRYYDRLLLICTQISEIFILSNILTVLQTYLQAFSNPQLILNLYVWCSPNNSQLTLGDIWLGEDLTSSSFGKKHHWLALTNWAIGTDKKSTIFKDRLAILKEKGEKGEKIFSKWIYFRWGKLKRKFIRAIEHS